MASKIDTFENIEYNGVKTKRPERLKNIPKGAGEFKPMELDTDQYKTLKNLDMSQKDIAVEMGMSAPTLRKYKKQHGIYDT